MKTIHIATKEPLSPQWDEWLGTLVQLGYRFDRMAPESIEEQVRQARPGDAVILDGMLPGLSELIYRVCSLAPETSVMVLTEVDSFSIYYEVLSAGGAIYISGPLSRNQFGKMMESVIAEELVA